MLKTYIELGWPLIPLCSPINHDKQSKAHKERCRCVGKTPLMEWKEITKTTEEMFQQWQEKYSNFNIALKLGNGILGIDIDGEEGEKLLLENSKGDLPITWEFTTGNGRRLLYAYPKELKTKKFTYVGTEAHSEVSILCEGQITVIPPSLHMNGKKYIWKDNQSPKDIDCALAPQWVRKLIEVKSIKKTVKKEDEFNFEEEFQATQFDANIPEEALKVSVNPIKEPKKKKGSLNIKQPAYLYQKIEEGARDNAMTQIIGYFLSKPEFRNMPQSMLEKLMLDYNNNYMSPPLTDQAIQDKLAYFLTLEQQKLAEIPKQKEWIVGEVVQMLLNRLETEDILVKHEQLTNSFYICTHNKGPWKVDDSKLITSKVWKYIQDPFYGDPSWGTQHMLFEALEALALELRSKNRSGRNIFDLNKHAKELSDFVVVDGQLLDWRNNKLLPWDPNYNSTTSFEVGFDPEATCPYWEQYMEEWLPDECIRNVLQEFMGSALLPEPAPEEKFIILTGTGSNGKSMFLNTMQDIFSKYSISLTPKKLSERFGPASLYGKLLNVCSEIDGKEKKISNTAQIKQIVSGEALTAEYKGKDPFQFKPVANLIFSCNDVPTVSDKTDAWYRRQLLIKFEQKFIKDDNITREMNKHIQEERAGIFNWLIAGLKRIKIRGYFKMDVKLQETQQEFKNINDPVESFKNDCLIVIPAENVQKMSGSVAKSQGVSAAIVNLMYNLWYQYQYGDDIRFRKSAKNLNRELELKGFKRARGQCLYRKKPTMVYVNTIINLTSFGFCEHCMQACEGNAMGTNEFILFEAAKKSFATQEE